MSRGTHVPLSPSKIIVPQPLGEAEQAPRLSQFCRTRPLHPQPNGWLGSTSGGARLRTSRNFKPALFTPDPMGGHPTHPIHEWTIPSSKGEDGHHLVPVPPGGGRGRRTFWPHCLGGRPWDGDTLPPVLLFLYVEGTGNWFWWGTSSKAFGAEGFYPSLLGAPTHWFAWQLYPPRIRANRDKPSSNRGFDGTRGVNKRVRTSPNGCTSLSWSGGDDVPHATPWGMKNSVSLAHGAL